MDRVIIQECVKNSPDVVFHPSEKLLDISGRSIPENPGILYSKIENWLTEYFADNDELNVRFRYDYINSGSSKCLFRLLKHLSSFELEGKNVNMLWLYEEDDDTILELGKYLIDALDLPMVIKMIE